MTQSLLHLYTFVSKSHTNVELLAFANDCVTLLLFRFVISHIWIRFTRRGGITAAVILLHVCNFSSSYVKITLPSQTFEPSHANWQPWDCPVSFPFGGRLFALLWRFPPQTEISSGPDATFLRSLSRSVLHCSNTSPSIADIACDVMYFLAWWQHTNALRQSHLCNIGDWLHRFLFAPACCPLTLQMLHISNQHYAHCPENESPHSNGATLQRVKL